jgi:hypothetical protein
MSTASHPEETVWVGQTNPAICRTEEVVDE